MGKKNHPDRLHSVGPSPGTDRDRLRQVRETVMEEFPPLQPARLQPATSGIGAQIRAARVARGFTWYSLAEKAGLPSGNVVRDVEYGREVSVSDIEAVVAALGLRLELVEQTA